MVVKIPSSASISNATPVKLPRQRSDPVKSVVSVWVNHSSMNPAFCPLALNSSRTCSYTLPCRINWQVTGLDPSPR